MDFPASMHDSGSMIWPRNTYRLNPSEGAASWSASDRPLAGAIWCPPAWPCPSGSRAKRRTRCPRFGHRSTPSPCLRCRRCPPRLRPPCAGPRLCLQSKSVLSMSAMYDCEMIKPLSLWSSLHSISMSPMQTVSSSATPSLRKASLMPESTGQLSDLSRSRYVVLALQRQQLRSNVRLPLLWHRSTPSLCLRCRRCSPQLRPPCAGPC